ncbi:arginine--tRNA ligase [Numidum massiliense]|uniref:arginine--tRNA ligase n=1 Tax=Numidum massiliense TaxID=1522315 RepID=UPI0006D5714B|nr:arginine--tRNA ligase [Numidum massiliense]
MDVKKQVAQILTSAVQSLNGAEVAVADIYRLLETPPNPTLGDFALPCFALAKRFRRPPQAIAAQLTAYVHGECVQEVAQHPREKSVSEKAMQAPIQKAEQVGAYVNIFLNRTRVGQAVVANVLAEGPGYGSCDIGRGEAVPIDFSSPNIAKPFSMGHLRSTVIGNALANMYAKCGYRPVRINHLGDWGTQFGKLMAAYKRWGDAAEVEKAPIPTLLALYVRFHDEAATSPSLEAEGRAWFKKLEDGEAEAVALWKWFRHESLQEFQKIYDLLGISFDSSDGEAFYNDKMDEVVALLEQKQLLERSEGADVVSLAAYDLPPCLIKKSDGATLYATRDLAAALYRYRTYRFAHALYVVGHEQRLHFQQLFAVLKKMGFEWAEQMAHVPFGLLLQDGKKMSTRKGKVVLLEHVLERAIAKVREHIKRANPSLVDPETVARQVGVGAVIFNDLKHNRLNDIEFSLDDMLTFEGETGPYVQYTYTRARSLLRKGGVRLEQRCVAGDALVNDSLQLTLNKDALVAADGQSGRGEGRLRSSEGLPGESSDMPQRKDVYGDAKAWAVATALMNFPHVVRRALDDNDPSQISKFVLDLAQAFNKYYSSVRVLAGGEGERHAKLALVAAVAIVLREGLRLLGIATPEQM